MEKGILKKINFLEFMLNILKHRYFSPRFYKDKIFEKGIIGFFKIAARKIGNPILSIFIFPFSLLLSLLGIRFINSPFTNHIGHLAIEPDCYIKEGVLGLRPNYFTIMLVPANKVANNHLLKYWGRYYTIISSPFWCTMLKPLSETKRLRYNVWSYCTAMDETASCMSIQRHWGERPPILSLSGFDVERGWQTLNKYGMHKGDWFVCVHCRESGFYNGPGHDFRNANIEDYIPAMQAVIDHGGWCIRIGDPSMKPLHHMDHVIDYAHLDIKSEWMDIFLCASCRILIGSSSGMMPVANVFGTPTVTANHVPMSVCLSFGKNDMGIPKLYWSIKDERYMTFKEILDSPAGNFRYSHLFEEAGLRLIDNSPDEIRDAALEMLNRLEGKKVYTIDDEYLHEQFISLFKPGHYSYGSCARVGIDFLKKYSYLLPRDE